MNIQKELFKLKDEEYAKFQQRLMPTIDPESIIGVRVPIIRSFAKQIKNTEECVSFINSLPHKYYDENMLHSVLLSFEADYEAAVLNTDKFLPYVDNWAVCDILSPIAFKKNKDKLINEIKRWTNSNKEYTIRFGIEMLMSHYLDCDFKEEYLEVPAKVKSEKYYVNMMISWFYATALVKKWDSTIPYLENNLLCKWVHNKTIQKACESYRITKKQKNYLKSLKK